MAPGSSTPPLSVGRYRVYDEIAAGGMASVHLGRLVGDEGFSRLVAIKRLHPHHAKERDIVAMFTDEARIAARIRHPNVVTTLDVVAKDGEVFLVMEYIHGESLSRLLLESSKRKQKIPPPIAAAIVSNALYGLHAAHEAKDAAGKPLGVIHRDISPQNILVGEDGLARVLDFGIARATGRIYQTSEGAIKGKIPYMSPEQLRAKPLDRRSDLYSVGIVLWEALVCKRLYSGAPESLLISRMKDAPVDPPSKLIPSLPIHLDAVIEKALRTEPSQRYPTALAMAEALLLPGAVASAAEVAAWLKGLANESLAARAALLDRIENEERRISSANLPKVPLPHRVEATVKMAAAALIASPLSKPPDEPLPDIDVMTTVPLRRDREARLSPLTTTQTEPLIKPTRNHTLPFSPPTPPKHAHPQSKEERRKLWLIWGGICLGVFLLSAGLVVLFVTQTNAH